MALLAGRFRLEERLGAGGMGEVYAAFDEREGRRVAIKRLAADADLEAIARFVREAQATAAAAHANVVEAHELVTREDGPPFIVLERLEGETLEAALERGPLAPAEAARVVVQLLAALEAVHRAGIVHRDVKPANVLLCEGGTRVKLIDFGVAKLLGERGLTRTGTLVGTPLYMAPEQLRDEPVDARTDVYAAGATLYEALTGRPPFVEDGARLMKAVLVGELTPIRDLRPSIDPALARVVHQALAKSRELRFESAAAMRVALDAWLDASERRAAAATNRRPRTRTRSRARSRAALALPLVLVAGVSLAAGAAVALGGTPKHLAQTPTRTLALVLPPSSPAPVHSRRAPSRPGA
jgi:serine/threonine-protein kinase